jgi:hypothetical protein
VGGSGDCDVCDSGMTSEIIGALLGAVITAGLSAVIVWLRRANNDSAEVLGAAAEAVKAVAPFWQDELKRVQAQAAAGDTRLRVYADRLGYAEALIQTYLAWFAENEVKPPVEPNGPRYPEGFSGPRSSGHGP